MERATFAAGCFWGVEEAFRNTKGVTKTAVGYTGGKKDGPTYNQVCSHLTGHTEAVLVEFDPKLITYEKLLDTFWTIHDPTQKNRQGLDIGNQYRSVIFYHDEQQRKAAERSKINLDASGRYSRPVATEIVSAVKFWPAEEYHQQYLAKKGKTTCRI